MGKRKGAYRVLVGKLEGRRPLERPRSRWEGYSKMDLREVGWGGGPGLDRSGSGYGQVAGFYKCGNQRSGSIKCGEFLEYFRTFWLLRKDSAPWSVSLQ